MKGFPSKLVGQKFGRLLVLEKIQSIPGTQARHAASRGKNNHVKWICKCDCGIVVKVPGSHLIRGNSKSCGCLRNELASQRRKAAAKGPRTTCYTCGIIPIDGRLYMGSYCLDCKKKKVIERSKDKDTHQKDLDTMAVYRRKLKAGGIAAYGGQCLCCSEDRMEFLSLDHINGDGAAHRKKTGLGTAALYLWLRKHNYPTEIVRVLCYNCNMALWLYGACPHGLTTNLKPHIRIGRPQ